MRCFAGPSLLPLAFAAVCGILIGGSAIGAVSLAAQTLSPHLSPDGRYGIVLLSDNAFGQVETLRVLLHPGTPGARAIFEQPGDTPMSFVRWRDANTAELALLPRDGEVSIRLLLTCQDQACRLDRLPDR